MSKFQKVDDVKAEEIERAEGIYREWLIGEESEADCYMRRFTMKKNGKMPLHKHSNLNHIQYVLNGRIKTTIGNEDFEVESGSFLLIPKNTPHSYENLSGGESQFICIIPAVEDRDTEILKD